MSLDLEKDVKEINEKIKSFEKSLEEIINIYKKYFDNDIAGYTKFKVRVLEEFYKNTEIEEDIKKVKDLMLKAEQTSEVFLQFYKKDFSINDELIILTEFISDYLSSQIQKFKLTLVFLSRDGVLGAIGYLSYLGLRILQVVRMIAIQLIELSLYANQNLTELYTQIDVKLREVQELFLRNLCDVATVKDYVICIESLAKALEEAQKIRQQIFERSRKDSSTILVI